MFLMVWICVNTQLLTHPGPERGSALQAGIFSNIASAVPSTPPVYVKACYAAVLHQLLEQQCPLLCSLTLLS
jgi:hypothetical protein